MKPMWTAVTQPGTGNSAWAPASSSGCSMSGTAASVAIARSSRLNSRKYMAVEATIEMTARKPKCVSMNAVSHPHGRATMRTGGAAKWVSVPPIETLTNRSPTVAYLRRVLG